MLWFVRGDGSLDRLDPGTGSSIHYGSAGFRSVGRGGPTALRCLLQRCQIFDQVHQFLLRHRVLEGRHEGGCERCLRRNVSLAVAVRNAALHTQFYRVFGIARDVAHHFIAVFQFEHVALVAEADAGATGRNC